ncbi:hypothetical protein HKCCE3408_13825 [Rhodobacterales bacterium HKCCE3408]|nr:hypothetical protein [Rhodobacterales bacterium HKCCE3408]
MIARSTVIAAMVLAAGAAHAGADLIAPPVDSAEAAAVIAKKDETGLILPHANGAGTGDEVLSTAGTETGLDGAPTVFPKTDVKKS